MAIFPFLAPDQGLFGVYDGHGKIGQRVSEFVLQRLPDALEDRQRTLRTAPADALVDAYIHVDNSLDFDASVSGTTAVTCFIKDQKIWTANCGDSRAIILRRTPSGAMHAIALTNDQKPDSPAEMQRILQMGGHVTPAGANGSPARVWHNLRGLAMARSIGDHAAASVGVIAEPEISEYAIDPDDYMLIVASDGVCELLDNDSIAHMVHQIAGGDPQAVCEEITRQSVDRWNVEEGDYRDDITVIALKFPWLPAA